MSIETPIGSTGATPGTSQTGSSGSEAGGEHAARQAAHQAAHQAAQQAKEQTKVVAGEAREHLSQLAGQTRGEVRQQVDQRSQQLTSSLQGLAGQLRSLRNGRPEEAGPLHHYLVDAEQRVSGWAERLEQGGPDMLLRDVRTFARRRPGAFLLAAAGAGFVAGRMVRVGVAASHDDDRGPDGASAYGVQRGVGATSYAMPNAMPPGTLAGPAAGVPLAPPDPTLPASGSGAFA